VTASITPESREQIGQILNHPVDWSYLLELATLHGVMPLVANNLMANGFSSQVPHPYLDRLNKNYHQTLYRNMVLTGELSSILAAFRNRRVEPITLKGTTLAEILYGNPALRTVSDIDLLVHPDDVPVSASILKELGYEKLPSRSQWEHPFHEAPYSKQAVFPIFIEIHRGLADSRLVSIPTPEIWRRAQPIELQGLSILILSPEDNLLFLAQNLFKQDTHLLRSLCDVAELLKKYAAVLDWDYIEESARSWQVDFAVYFSLRQARDILGAPAPVSPLKALKPGWWRRLLFDFVMNREVLISPVKGERLRSWTATFVGSLTLKHTRQALAVLSRHQGPWKRAAWMRTAVWIFLVLAAALQRNMTRLTFLHFLRSRLDFCLEKMQGLHIYRRISRRLHPRLTIRELDETAMKNAGAWLTADHTESRTARDIRVTRFIAKKGERVIGSVELVRRSEECYPHNGYWLSSLEVKTRYRGMGIGEELSHKVIEKSKKEEAKSLSLLVRMNNYQAIKLYRKLGFEKVVIPALEGQLEEEQRILGNRRIVMSLPLNETPKP
jgi:ribosomal protein S18 acetylase RimI-like enzyme/predicted nucleotidyltransferase